MDDDTLEITPVDNGAHSFAMALKSVQDFLADPTDATAIKDAILRSHHGIETLVKSALFDHNPVMLLRDDAKVGTFVAHYAAFLRGDNAFLLDDAKTVGVNEGLMRLRSIGLLDGVDDRAFHALVAALEQLTAVRNAIQHFGVRLKGDRMLRVLGSLLPRFLDVFEELGTSSKRFRGYGYRLFMMSGGLGDLATVRKRIRDAFPDADAVLATLRHRYDQLLEAAAAAIRGQEFPDTAIRLSIRDHGEVGAPPYVPELNAEGLLTLRMDTGSIHRLGWRDQWPDDVEPIRHVISYDGQVTIDAPTIDGPDLVVGSSGKVALHLTIGLKQAHGIISLPGYDEHLEVLRDISVTVSAQVSYHGYGAATGSHYSVDTLNSAKGTLRVEIRGYPLGYDPDDPSQALVGILEAPLDQRSAPFRLHAFREPDGRLASNRTLEWAIGCVGVLRFL